VDFNRRWTQINADEFDSIWDFCKKSSARRQKAEGRRQKAEGKKAYTVSFFTFVNWIVISATCTSLFILHPSYFILSK
jgi:hypothetical protein